MMLVCFFEFLQGVYRAFHTRGRAPELDTSDLSALIHFRVHHADYNLSNRYTTTVAMTCLILHVLSLYYVECSNAAARSFVLSFNVLQLFRAR